MIRTVIMTPIMTARQWRLRRAGKMTAGPTLVPGRSPGGPVGSPRPGTVGRSSLHIGTLLLGMGLLAIGAPFLGVGLLRAGGGGAGGGGADPAPDAAGPPKAGAGAVIVTVAGTGRGELGLFEGEGRTVTISQPFGLKVGARGDLFICEVGHGRILRWDPRSGRAETVVGNGKPGSSGDGGPAREASLDEPYEIDEDRAGDLYWVEMKGAVVRKLDRKTGRVSRVAGTGRHGFGGDGGPAVKAQFSSPHSLALDGKGGLYIADIGNHRVRRVDLGAGTIDTVAGDGTPRLPEEGALARGQPLKGPRALAVSEGTLWIALREGNSVWRLDLSSGRLFRVAGTGEAGFRDGPAREATFRGPKGLAVGPGGSLFVADTENHAIRTIDPAKGQVGTLAGNGPESRGYGGDGGPARQARLDRPHGVAVDPAGAVYIGDSENHRVRRVSP